MKKFVAVLMCLITVLSLYSCQITNQKGEEPTTPNQGSEEATTTPDQGSEKATTTPDQESEEATTTPDQESEETTTTTDTTPPSPTDVALQMYEAAIHDKICVVDEQLGEIKLKDCRFPSDNLRLGECEILYKAILDLDGDGINEYVIQSKNKDHIVLRHYDGKVYSYCFDAMSFFNLNNDGSFYWIDSYDLSNCTRGYNRIAFDGASRHVKEIYRIKQTSPYDYDDGDREYFVDGKQITRKEFMDYYHSNCINKELTVFSPLDISCEYPISSEKACELAADYWGIFNGMDDGAVGTHFLHTIVILEKPNNDMPIYRIGWYMEAYTNHVLDGPCSQPPYSVKIYEELIVDATTGECREYIHSPAIQ